MPSPILIEDGMSFVNSTTCARDKYLYIKENHS